MLQTAWLLPPTRLLTLGFDPARFQTEPPACYRASWQLPGWDSHPQATTSLCWITIYTSTSNPGHTAEIEQAADPPLARRRAGVRAGHCAGASTAPRCAPLARSGSQPVSTLSPALSARQGRCPSARHRDFAEEPGVSSPLAGRDAHFERQADLVVTGPALSSGGKAGVAGYRARSKKDCATLRRASLAGDLARGR